MCLGDLWRDEKKDNDEMILKTLLSLETCSNRHERWTSFARTQEKIFTSEKLEAVAWCEDDVALT